MEKRKKAMRFLKNRMWKSKVANRLKGRPEDVCLDYLSGTIDHEQPIHVVEGPKKWLAKFMENRKMENFS